MLLALEPDAPGFLSASLLFPHSSGLAPRSPAGSTRAPLAAQHSDRDEHHGEDEVEQRADTRAEDEHERCGLGGRERAQRAAESGIRNGPEEEVRQDSPADERSRLAGVGTVPVVVMLLDPVGALEAFPPRMRVPLVPVRRGLVDLPGHVDWEDADGAALDDGQDAVACGPRHLLDVLPPRFEHLVRGLLLVQCRDDLPPLVRVVAVVRSVGVGSGFRRGDA